MQRCVQLCAHSSERDFVRTHITYRHSFVIGPTVINRVSNAQQKDRGVARSQLAVAVLSVSLSHTLSLSRARARSISLSLSHTVQGQRHSLPAKKLQEVRGESVLACVTVCMHPRMPKEMKSVLLPNAKVEHVTEQ